VTRGRHTKRRKEIKKQAYADIAKARFTSKARAIIRTRPSRSGFHTAECSYEEDGKQVAPFTNFAGLYQRVGRTREQGAVRSAAALIDRKAAVNPETQFNFVSDADIIGGNSGSPVVNKANEFVGIIFDATFSRSC